MTIEAIRALELEPVPAPAGGFGFDRYGWAPYDLDDFVRMLNVAISVTNRMSFVDVGCGIGTKCMAARTAGLSSYGIDCVPEYVEAARSRDVRCEVADAYTWSHYDEFGIVYVSHPFRVKALEVKLEQRILRQMAPGAVFMTPRRAAEIPDGWTTVLEEKYARDVEPYIRSRGVYVKG